MTEDERHRAIPQEKRALEATEPRQQKDPISGGIEIDSTQERIEIEWFYSPLKNGLGVPSAIFIVFADSCHFAKISPFNLRMHSIHKICTKEKKGWFQKFRMDRNSQIRTWF